MDFRLILEFSGQENVDEQVFAKVG